MYANFHVDVLEGIRRGIVLDCEKDAEIFTGRNLSESRDVIEGTVGWDLVVSYIMAIRTQTIPLLVSKLFGLLSGGVIVFLDVKYLDSFTWHRRGLGGSR